MVIVLIHFLVTRRVALLELAGVVLITVAVSRLFGLTGVLFALGAAALLKSVEFDLTSAETPARGPE